MPAEGPELPTRRRVGSERRIQAGRPWCAAGASPQHLIGEPGGGLHLDEAATGPGDGIRVVTRAASAAELRGGAVGRAGIEPATSCVPSKRHAPPKLSRKAPARAETLDSRWLTANSATEPPTDAPRGSGRCRSVPWSGHGPCRAPLYAAPRGVPPVRHGRSRVAPVDDGGVATRHPGAPTGLPLRGLGAHRYATTRQALRTLAKRVAFLTEQATEAQRQLDELTEQAAPALRDVHGVGIDTAATLLVTVG